MGTVTYTVIDGEVISENRGGTQSFYVPDPLGSTVALLDNTQAQTDTFSYWPYGENNGRTGTTATPFQFVGTAAYYQDSASRTYVRARTLNTALGRWMMEDPIGFDAGDLNLYSYVGNIPALFTDPLGLQAAAGAIPFPGSGAILGGLEGVAAPVAAVCIGGEAGWELICYRPGHPCGLFTDLGEAIGDVIGDIMFPPNKYPPWESSRRAREERNNRVRRRDEQRREEWRRKRKLRGPEPPWKPGSPWLIRFRIKNILAFLQCVQDCLNLFPDGWPSNEEVTACVAYCLATTGQGLPPTFG